MKNHMVLIETNNQGKTTVSIGLTAEMRLNRIRMEEVRGEYTSGKYDVFDADVNARLYLEELTVKIKPAERNAYDPCVCFEQDGGNSRTTITPPNHIIEGARHLFSLYPCPTVSIYGWEKDDYPFRVPTEQLFQDWADAGFPILWER